MCHLNEPVESTAIISIAKIFRNFCNFRVSVFPTETEQTIMMMDAILNRYLTFILNYCISGSFPNGKIFLN